MTTTDLTPLRPAAAEVAVIEPRPPGIAARLRELWRYRRLLSYFGEQNLRKMYANTWLGRLWIPLRPLLNVAMPVLIFGGLLKAPSDGVPYFLFFAAGTAAWQLLNNAWYFGTRSLEMHRRYLKRIHVPRLIPLVAALWPGGMWTLLNMGVLAVGLGYYQAADGKLYLVVGPRLLEAVAGIALIAALAITLSMFTAIYGAQARDPRFLVRYALNVWYFATPVIYPLSAVPPRWVNLAQLNPMATPMEMVRHGLFGVGTVELRGVLVSIGAIVVVGFLGMRFFGRSEAKALDYL